jgi:hypothetical protein
LTRGQYDRAYPNISAPYWDRSLYGAAGDHQYDRLEVAISLDRAAALESASWGRFQIMGSNFRICGYSDFESYVTAMMDDEANHLDAFCEFCIHCGLIGYLIDHDWAHFALRYNGPGNVSDYAGKLARAYFKHAGGGVPQTPSGPSKPLQIGSYGPSVMELQQQLVQLGYQVVPDGDFGPRTKRAVMNFQRNHNLASDGIVGPLTEAAILAAINTVAP